MRIIDLKPGTLFTLKGYSGTYLRLQYGCFFNGLNADPALGVDVDTGELCYSSGDTEVKEFWEA